MKTVVSILIACATLTGGVSAQTDGEPRDLVLDGVIVAANPADSVALVRRSDGGRARAVRVGNEYAGHVLIEVTREGALLGGPYGRIRLALAGGPEPMAVPSEPEEPEEIDPEFLWERRSFSRAETNARLEKEIPVILSDTEVTPRVVEGEIRGLELLRLPDGTVLSQSGLLPGDVLRSINEEPLRGVDSLWKLLARFARGDELRVVVERRGEVVRLAYDLTN